MTTAESYLKVFNGPALQFKIRPGDRIPEGGAAFKAVQTGQFQVQLVPKEVYGIPFKSYAVPILEEGKVCNCILMGRSIEKGDNLFNVSRQVSDALEKIFQSHTCLSQEIQKSVLMNSETMDGIKSAGEITRETDKMLKFIQTISSRTNILGLNASI
ncbi:MAG TPA: hypothetical protein PLJ29_09995, partial [Leptospiraceae bacterium]|nr:hypothetical protein [Leptospiraceae bacterium]